MGKHVSAYKAAKLREYNPKEEHVSAFKAAKQNRGSDVGYVAKRAGIDFLRVGEGVVDAALVPVDLLTGNVDRAKSRFLDSPVDAMRERLDEEYNPGKVAGFIGDIAGGIGQSVGYGLISAIPYAGKPMMYSSIIEQSISSAAEKTGEVGLKEIGYGATAGAVEGILESKLGAGVNAAKSIGSAILKKTGINVAESAAKAGGKSMLKSVLTDTAKGFAGEFAEEAISEAVDPALLRLYNIDESAQFSLKDVAYAGLIGGLSGGMMSAGPAAINYRSAVSVGRALQESRLDGDLINRAKYTLSALEAAQTRSTSQIKGKPEGDTKETAKEWLSRTSENRKVKRLSKETAQLADKIRRNIAAYEKSMADPAMAQSEPVAALLGELRGNLFLVGYAYEADVIEQVMMEADDKQRQAFVDAINEELAAQGKKHDYTLADFDANKDDIRRGLAGRLMMDELQGDTAEGGAEATEKPAEPAQAPKDTAAEQVDTQEENAATEDLSGIEEEVWRAVTDETVKGYGTQNEQEVVLLRAAVSQNVPEKSIPLMLERFREGTDMTPAEFADAWADGVLLFGRLGLNEETISQESALSRMSEKARHASIEYGKWLSEEQRSKEQEAAKKKKRPVKEGESRKPKGEVVRHPGINLKADLDDAQFTAYKAAEIMAPALKADIEIHKGLERNGKQVNGYYDTKTNTIHINIDAVRDGKHIALYTLGHEVAHYIKAWSPKKFYELGDYVMDQLGEKAEKAVRDKLNFMKRNGLVDGLDETEAYDRAYEEVVADGMELVLTDGTVLDALARENKTLWQKIKDRIFEIIEKIKKAYSDLSKTSRTAQILSETMDSLDEIEQLFYEGVREAGERTRTAGVGTRTEGGKVYSFAGEKANAANVETLSKAKRRIEAGEDAETVRQETGWFIGYDGKWRFEIDDSKLKLKQTENIPNYITVGELLHHPQLFRNYPDLAHADIVFQKLDGKHGSYNVQFDTINVEYSLKHQPEIVKKVILHELQHAIQAREGFASGASVGYWNQEIESGYDARTKDDIRKQTELEEQLNRIREESPDFYNAMMELERMTPTVPRGKVDWETLEQIEPDPPEWEAYDNRREALEKQFGEHEVWDFMDIQYDISKLKGNPGRTPSELYFSTAGEIEARNVADRIDMDPEQRKNTRPDIDREDVVFAEVVGDDEGRMYSIDDDYDRRFELLNRISELRRKKESIESTDEYKNTANQFITNVLDAETPEQQTRAMEEYSEWITNSEHGKISKELADLEKKYEALRERSEEKRKEAKEPDAYEAREKAVEHFGYTDNFGVAGYILPDGRMLNFSGDKDKGYGIRGQDHRAIGYVFENLKGNAALARFVKDGNIRIIAESPGITISNQTVPSDQQYAKIREFINAVKSGRAFYVDFMDEKGVNAGSVAYEGTVDETEIIYDIKEFFRTGEVRDRNDDILYSIDETPETPDVSDSPFDKALRRAGLSHLVEDTAEAETTETAPPPRKAPRESDPEEDRRDRIRAHETLANALMEAAQNEHEFRLVKNYKQKAAELAEAEVRKEDLRKKTAEVNREIDTLQSKLKGVDKTKREPWVMTALTDAQKRKGELLDEMDALDEKLRTETDKLLSLASAKQLRKLIRAERSKAAAMERSAERARQREMDSKEWAKETVKKAREESEEKVKKARQEAHDYKAAVYKTSMEKVYKARREATDYKRAVYRTAYAKADEKNQKYRDRLDEMAKQSMERREITSRKRAVQRILGTLNTMLYHPNRQKHVPEELRGLTETVLASAEPKKFAVNRDHIREMSDLAAKIERLERKVARTAEEQTRLEKMKSKYEHLEEETISVKRQAEALLVAFKKYQSSVTTSAGFDQALIDKMTADVESIEEAPLKEMTLESLKAVENFYTMLKHQIDEQNNLFMQGKEARVSEFGNNATTEAHDAKSLKFLSPKSMELKGMANIRQFFWKNMKPLTVFEAIGSDTFTRLFQSVLNGENVWARDIEEARGKIVETRDKYGYGKWELDKRVEVKDKDGKTVRLSLSEMMSLYAYAKRKQAMGHLEGGGFVLDPGATEMAKGKVISFADMERRLNHAERHVVDQLIIGEIASKLTAEQKAYVDEMQTYLTKLGERGNTVSRKLYGIDIFTEEYYFPIKVKSEYLESHTGRTGDPNIKNRGMTKEVTPEADNPLVLQGFDAVMVDHINSMATYHAFVLPVEDLTRVLNYKPSNAKIDEDGNWTVDESRKDYSTLKAVIEEKYGAEANRYIEQLIRDLNGGARRDAAATLLDKGITGFKRASTMASLSVLFQQPTSLIRAAAYIDPKYLFGQASIVDFANHKKLWERLCKYAPVGIIKEMGGYDTGVGARTGDYLNAKNYKTPKEKWEAFIKPERFGGDSNYRAEVFGKGAAYADEMAWIQMFEACVSEQADKLGKSRDSEEVLKAAGKRFEEVVRRTQVYDSTLTRTEFMRSKDTGMKMATAFMAEPSTIVSMVADAIMKAERGDTAFLRRTAGAVAGAVIINALASSLVYAMRDDDEEKTYGEKYVASVAMEAAEAINPLEYLPYFRDIMSIMKGYEIERTDMTLISNLFQQVELLTNSKRTVGEKVLGVSGAVSAFFGIPMTNLTRDAKGIVNTVMGGVDTERGTAKGMSAALKEEFSGIFGLFDEQTKNEYQIYQAYVSGDTAHYNRVKARYKSDQAAEMALRQALRDNDPRISEAAEAKHSGDLAVYESLVDQIEAEGIFDRNIVIRAVNNEVSELKRAAEKGELVPKDETATDEEETAESLYTASDLNNALERGDTDDFAAIMASLVEDKVSAGKTEAQAKASVKSSITAYWKKQYLSGYQDTEIRKRIIAILTETGLYGNRNDVATMCEGWVKNSK